MFAASKTAGAAAGSTPDAQFNYVTMLLHGDGTNGAQNNTFLDSSTNNFTITRNGNTTQGSFSPYGSNWSNYFVRSSSQYLTVSNSGGQFSFGTGAFTIECWINLSSLPSSTGYPASYWIFGGGPVNSNPGIDFYINNTQIGFNLTDFTSPTAIGNHGMSVGTWYHVAVVRGGGSNQTVSIYVNGTRVATASSVTATADAATTGIAISAAEPSGATGGNFDGYISNHRIVKGTAVYDPTQSSLTVPTSPLTAITNTSLLTCQSNRFKDNSTNNLTITVNGTPSVERFNPFGASTAYSTSVIGGSGYFDGSGDYLTIANSTQTDLGSGDFTVECWFYQFSVKVTSCISLNTVTGTGYALGASTTANKVWWYANSAAQILSSATFNYNTWNHLAAVRNSGTTTLYLNGVSVGSFSDSINYAGTTTYIGSDEVGQDWNGYIAGTRIVKGTAVYTSAFTPPTVPPTAITNTQLLTNYTNGAIFDNAMMNDLETVGNAQISTSVVKYGTGSLAFDGNGDWLKAANTPNIQLGTMAFTLEFWFNTTASTQYTCFVSNENTSGGGVAILINSSSSNGIIQVYNGASGLINQTSTSYRDGSWHHLALVRDSSGSRLYLDGTQTGSTNASQASTSFDNTTPQPWIIGNNVAFSGRDYAGYIDDFRITKGYARYTANFTPPTAAFPNIGPV